MNPELTVCRVGADETSLLREFSISTFIDTYSTHNTPENMTTYIDKSFNHNRLQLELGSSDTFYYFAKRSADIVGYLKLNFGNAQTNRSLDEACEIERIYVGKKYQGLKTGKHLLHKAVKNGQEAGLKWLWLSVWDQNKNAIGFYMKMGFEVFGSHDFSLGSEVQTDRLMRLRLSSE
jgi:ribosomal protein S18 acetylase RimI-like enzyme